MLTEIADYFDCCLKGITKTIILPFGVLIIIIKYIIKEREDK